MWGFYGGNVETVWRLALWEAAGAFFQVNRGFRVCGRYATERNRAQPRRLGSGYMDCVYPVAAAEGCDRGRSTRNRRTR
ncbi:hypothetical protein C4K05_5904 [Pseudomonas chlororaphis subsp. aureofaciens]|uniref:Uncharacterized protein n=1 Tax=Pseudomonas chlororaphis subsp. aureofaciens TaxID=587851 RepID=A0AAD0ZJE4_9PSED|nr:hypothetical protein C4K13_6018 [Pseudomonas chlororaphis subsp. aureofaciens]AZE26315.1 hypothetical protein C4K08_5933 [Pseudomonas chlororaphis subsp. aureofaciens]AZE32557.1 hypothetical protein C4K07_5817 [Pseudomonas chlororaphis subsp. aureofaciens]AZE38837.1 hypothetical protein C4K06_5849 [Pseudomonas chlororaphis subsp. aureofaciens]AZE45199.1 hypothetical protein C4K05_5904 [Pseudomonas chlororaphis subsp. aureofaciens]